MNNLEKKLLELKKNSFFEQAKEAIEKYEKIIVLGHINPDGDCIGSQIAFYYSLKQKYPNKKIYFPFAKKNYSNFLLPKNYQNELDPTAFDNALVIVVDLNTPDRIPVKIPEANFIIRIDHHIQEKGVHLGNLVWADKDMIACCEMIYLFLKILDLPTEEKISTSLLLGIITDSGNFKYPGVNSLTFDVVSALLNEGAQLQTIYNNLTKTMMSLKLDAYCLNNIVQTEGFISFVFQPKDKDKIPNIEKIDNPFLAQMQLFNFVKGINVWAFFVQVNQSDFIRAELRCIERLDVEKIAVKYGGGGHKNAAGIAQVKDWETVSEIIVDLKKLKIS